MSDRIFSTQRQDQGLGPAEVINTVNYEKVAQMLEEVMGETVPAATEPLIGFAALTESSKQDVVTAKKEEKEEDDGKSNFKRKIPKGGDCEECGKIHPCACDMGKAAMAGDDISLGVMAEIRNQRRYAMLQQHEETIRVASSQEQEDQIRYAERQAIAEGLQALEQYVEKVSEKVAAVESSEPKFQSVDELTASQRDRFSKWAQAQGWPTEYVEAFITPKTASIEDIPSHIMVIASKSDITPDVRQNLIESMCREAKLKPEQASRLQSYWESEVGLPGDWVSKLVKEPDIK